MSALGIQLLKPTGYYLAGETNSLLRAASLFSPTEFVFILTRNFVQHTTPYFVIELPCFPRSTSIELDTGYLPIRLPPTGEFTALKSLSIKGNLVNLGAVLDRCPRLHNVNLAFRSATLDSIEATLTSLKEVVPNATVCLLDIHIHRADRIRAPRFASLLCAMARVSPQQLVLTLHDGGIDETLIDELPYFSRVTSIKMSLRSICFTQLPAAEFSVLQELSLSGCRIANLTILVTRCPRLRVLTLTDRDSTSDITVHSTTLQELNINSRTECRSIDIVTPMLQQLMLDVHAYMDLSVSISAPMVETVMWEHSYIGLASMFGFWSLRYMSLKTVHRLSRVHALCLHISANDHLGAELDFALEIEKILITKFSMLELHLEATNHVSGALLSRLFGMHHIQTATERLNVILEHSSKAIRECRNCPCEEPKNWRSQSILLPRLEEVEIKGFNGKHRQIDLLELVLRCAPMLKTVTIKLKSGLHRENFRGGFRKIYNIFLVYPSVSYSVYLYNGWTLTACAWLAREKASSKSVVQC